MQPSEVALGTRAIDPRSTDGEFAREVAGLVLLWTERGFACLSEVERGCWEAENPLPLRRRRCVEEDGRDVCMSMMDRL